MTMTEVMQKIDATTIAYLSDSEGAPEVLHAMLVGINEFNERTGKGITLHMVHMFGVDAFRK